MTEAFLRDAMDTHGDTVYRLALCRTQSTADAEDVYQEVFLRLWGQPAQNWTEGHKKAGLIRATVNRCTDLHRAQARRPVLPLDELPDLVRPTDEAQALWEAVAHLPEQLAIPVQLHYGEGYSTQEIGALLGVPAVTVRTRLHRARKQLKTLLGGDDDEE